MFTHVVSYDLNWPGQLYPPVLERLKALGARRLLFSQWLVTTNMTCVQLRDDLLQYMDGNDAILVIDVTNAPMAWRGLQTQLNVA